MQFIPLTILPALVGTSLAYHDYHKFSIGFLSVVILGVISLHLGANAIDDYYDYRNGVDKVANEMFPKEFGGWKPLPRGLISLRDAKLVSAGLFATSLVIGAYFWYAVGYWAFLFALTGVLLATFYTAPPLKLDYRGYGLGEISILLSFGPIPVLGAFYVQTGLINLTALLVSIPVGLLTVTILIDHDLIFYEVYSKCAKMSLATVLGRRGALKLSLFLSVVAYSIMIGISLAGMIPLWTPLAAVVGGLLLARKRGVYSQSKEPPPYYLPFTVNGMIANWAFSLILALTLLL